MIPTFHLHKELPTDLKKVNTFVERISRKVLALGGSEEAAFKTKLALEEALTNAMRHGNMLNKRRLVAVNIKADKKKIILDVHDQGKGFDIRSVPDPTKGAYAGRSSGRGIFLMRIIMDKVEFYDGGSGVRMEKYFR